jgi:hypothetical protein
MITEKELVELQLNSAFGHMMPTMVKNIVNRELDKSIWEDGYETAVTERDLNYEEGIKLLDILLKNNPNVKIDLDELESVIDSELPQSAFAKVSWIVSENASFVMTDSLRVAKFQQSKVIWCTQRIALDGISLKEIRNEKIFCLAWQGSSAYEPDEPFILDYQTGEVLSGNIVNW